MNKNVFFRLISIGLFLVALMPFVDRSLGEGEQASKSSFNRAEDIEAVNQDIIVQRAYYDAACDPQETTCEPITSIPAGQQVRVELTIIPLNELAFAVIEDPIPSGAEAIDPQLEITPGDRKFLQRYLLFLPVRLYYSVNPFGVLGHARTLIHLPSHQDPSTVFDAGQAGLLL